MQIQNLPLALIRNLADALPKPPSGFAPRDDHAAAPPPAPPIAGAPTSPVPSVAMLVTMAATQDDTERRRRRARDAERGIDALEGLHRELLTGAATPARLAEIAQWSRDHAAQADPALAALLADIDLRVRVELAKFDVKV